MEAARRSRILPLPEWRRNWPGSASRSSGPPDGRCPLAGIRPESIEPPPAWAAARSSSRLSSRPLERLTKPLYHGASGSMELQWTRRRAIRVRRKLEMNSERFPERSCSGGPRRTPTSRMVSRTSSAQMLLAACMERHSQGCSPMITRIVNIRPSAGRHFGRRSCWASPRSGGPDGNARPHPRRRWRTGRNGLRHEPVEPSTGGRSRTPRRVCRRR